MKKEDSRLIELFKSFGNLPAGQKLTSLVKVDRSCVKNFLQSRYSNSIARKILSILKFPKLLSFEEYLASLSDFLYQANAEKLLMAFKIHDFNDDGKVDYNDTYDLLYAEKELNTPSYALI